MKPGSELDAFIAEKVMGLKPLDLPLFSVKDDFDKIVISHVVSEWFDLKTPKHYSTDIAAAWEVVEKLRAEEFFFIVSNSEISTGLIKIGENKIFASFGKKHRKVETTVGETSPHAICLAALKAVGAEI